MSRRARSIVALILSIFVAYAPVTVVAGGCAGGHQTAGDTVDHAHHGMQTGDGTMDDDGNAQAPAVPCEHCGGQHHCNGGHSPCSQGLSLINQHAYPPIPWHRPAWASGAPARLPSADSSLPYRPPIRI